MSIVIPIIVALSMGKRTRKMTIGTYLLSFAYWFVTALESVGLLEVALKNNQYKRIIFTTETIICITMIVINSYAIVTLCSYINPMNIIDNKRTTHKFDFVYRVVLAVSGIVFAEIPLFISRCHILVQHKGNALPGTFYVWFMKDILWLVLIPVLLYVQRFGQKYLRIPCKPRFENKHLHFEPEKRDAYINRHKRKIYSVASKDSSSVPCSTLQKCNSEPNISCKKAKLNVVGSRSMSSLDKLEKNAFTNPKFVSKAHLTFQVKKCNNKQKKQKSKKRVTFKLDLGMGKFLELKPRSDSPQTF